MRFSCLLENTSGPSGSEVQTDMALRMQGFHHPFPDKTTFVFLRCVGYVCSTLPISRSFLPLWSLSKKRMNLAAKIPAQLKRVGFPSDSVPGLALHIRYHNPRNGSRAIEHKDALTNPADRPPDQRRPRRARLRTWQR